MASLNLGQICNTQNGIMALEPQVGKYPSDDQPNLESARSTWRAQAHLDYLN